MTRMSMEVTAKKTVGFVTKGQALDLIAQSTAAGAPDSAAIGFDALLEFTTPVRARRMVVSWDTDNSTLNRTSRSDKAADAS